MTQPTQVSAAPSAAEKAAAAAVPLRIIQAWVDQDASAFAEVFTEDGTMILPGIFKKGREDIREFMAAAFAGPYKGTRVTGQPIDMRFLGRNSCIMLTQGGVLMQGDKDVAAERAVHGSWLVVKREGVWLLAAYQNSPRNA